MATTDLHGSASRLFWKLFLTCCGLESAGGGRCRDADLALDAACRCRSVASQRWIWALVGRRVRSCVFGLAYWLIGHIIRPVDSLNEAAEAIAAGDYEHRVYVPNRDELGTLAGTLNRMSQELDGDDAAQPDERPAIDRAGRHDRRRDRRRRAAADRAGQRGGRPAVRLSPAGAEGRPLLEVVRNHAAARSGDDGARDAASRSGWKPNPASRHPAASDPQHVDIHVQPLPGEPCPGVVLVMHDTTELRRLESLRRDFVANVSHELKTPLSSIKAYTETLRNGAMNDPETSQRFLARIEEQSERLHHLIMDMLMLARIESDQQAFEIVPVDVAAVVAVVPGRPATGGRGEAHRARAVEPSEPAGLPRAGRSRRPARDSR